MKIDNQGNIIVKLSVMFGTTIIIVVAAFAYYLFIKPQNLEINTISYTGINRMDYNIDENELNEGLFTTLNFQVDDTQVQMHKDLHDVYVGRENPFNTFSDNREDIDTIDELNSNKGNSSDKEENDEVIDPNSEENID